MTDRPELRRYRLPSNRRYRLAFKPNHAGSPPSWAPRTITLIGVKGANGSPMAIDGGVFLDGSALSARQYQLNPNHKSLAISFSVKGQDYGLSVQLSEDGFFVSGVLIHRLTMWEFSGGVDEVKFTCGTSQDCGASIRQRGSVTTVIWQADSAAWQDGKWQSDTLRVGYGVKQRYFVNQLVWELFCSFEDCVSYNEWKPSPDDGIVAMSINDQLSFVTSGTPVPADGGGALPGTFPYLLLGDIDASGNAIAGAMICGSYSPQGVPVGFHGGVDNHGIVGRYSTAEGRFSVVDGRMTIAERPVDDCRIDGSTLSWHGLSAEQSKLSGLPVDGSLSFSSDGSVLLDGRGKRLGPAESMALEIEPVIGERQLASPSGETLLNMSPYVQQSQAKGTPTWFDSVQQLSRPDMMKIMYSYMDPTLYETFISRNPCPPLPEYLAAIAGLPGSDGTDPKDFYVPLGYRVLTDQLTRASDKYAVNLNGARARKQSSVSATTSDVWAVHAPKIYAYHFDQQLGISAYIEDQQANQETYNLEIELDAAAWKQRLSDEIPDKATRDDACRVVDKLVQAGKSGKFWAYFLYRYCISNQAMGQLTAAAVGYEAASDPMRYMVDTHRYQGLMGLLDPDNVFFGHYGDMVSAHMMGTVMPQLINPAASPREQILAMTIAMVRNFMQAQRASQDPVVQQMIAALENLPAVPPQLRPGAAGITRDTLQSAAADEDGEIKQWCDVLLILADSLANAYSWEKFADKFDDVIEEWLHGDALMAVRLLGTGLLVAGLVGFIFGVKDWDKLNPVQKAKIVAAGAAVFSQIGYQLAKRISAFAVLWRDGYALRAALRAIIRGNACEEAAWDAENALSRWLLGTTETMIERQAAAALEVPLLELPSAAAALPAAAGAVVPVVEDISFVQRYLGRSLSIFMSTRVAGVLAIVSLVLSAIQLAQAKTAKQVAIAGLGVGTSVLFIAGVAGEWLLSAGVIEEGSMIAAAVPVIGPLVLVASIVGIILMFVLGDDPPPPDPVKEFGQKQAAELGLWMAEAVAIESFKAFKAAENTYASGIAICFSANRCLQMRSDGTVSMADAVDQTDDTVFYANVDEHGHVTFARLVVQDESLVPLVLQCGDSATVAAAAPIADAAKKDQQKWKVVPNGQKTHDGHNLLSAEATLQNVYWAGQPGASSWLAAERPAIKLSAQGDVVTLSMQQRKPSDLVYAPISFPVYERNNIFYPRLLHRGSPSLNWTISPSLPTFLALDPQTGAISQPPGAGAQIMAETTYTVTARNAAGAVQASVSIAVTAS